jgi:hypothetical protein
MIFQITPPTDAVGGSYSATFSTVWLRSNEIVADAGFNVDVNVNAQPACNQSPTFSEITSSDNAISSRNNKPVNIALSGAVSTPDSCAVENLYYVLTDEYGELDQQENIYLRTDGSFVADVEMIASRKGGDKDGRHYTIKFFAENKAGVGESAEAVFVVGHDNRSK